MKNKVEFLNPEGMHKNPAFSQAVAVSGNYKTLYIGGQNAVNAKGEIVGKGDLKAQTVQALKNMRIVLEAGGASFNDTIKWTIYVVHGQDFRKGYEAFQEMDLKMTNPPIITSALVAGLAHPDFLVEIEAVAIVPA